MADQGWETGDLLGVTFPVDVDALRVAGPSFLTRAFQAAGTIDLANRVTDITELEPLVGGSTGRKALLSVTYRDASGLPHHLFVKFSRDFDDELRDRGKRQMEAEVRFGLLSRAPDFPVAVPRCLFADYHIESGSGLLISERIAFGTEGIEPHYQKARDYEIHDLRSHYDALVSAIARLAGSHRAGHFPEELMANFEPRSRKATVRHRPLSTADEIRDRVARYADFADRCPQLLPASIRSHSFIGDLTRQAPRAVENAAVLRAALQDGARSLIAFCHWNANIDNAWYWRGEDGDLACGLLDWGNVGQMNVVTALSSCLVFTEPDFLIDNLDHFFALFSTVFEEQGGGSLDPAELTLQFALQMVTGGLQWPLDIVPLIEHHVPDLTTVKDRFDPLIQDDEFARTQLHLLTTYLMLWRVSDPSGLTDWAISRAEGARTRRPSES